jgi:hypothetical protein
MFHRQTPGKNVRILDTRREVNRTYSEWATVHWHRTNRTYPIILSYHPPSYVHTHTHTHNLRPFGTLKRLTAACKPVAVHIHWQFYGFLFLPHRISVMGKFNCGERGDKHMRLKMALHVKVSRASDATRKAELLWRTNASGGIPGRTQESALLGRLLQRKDFATAGLASSQLAVHAKLSVLK